MIVKINYGTAKYEQFIVTALTADDDGEPWGRLSHVDMRDDNTGEGWALNPDQAVKLAQALIRCAEMARRAGGK